MSLVCIKVAQTLIELEMHPLEYSGVYLSSQSAGCDWYIEDVRVESGISLKNTGYFKLNSVESLKNLIQATHVLNI